MSDKLASLTCLPPFTSISRLSSRSVSPLSSSTPSLTSAICGCFFWLLAPVKTSIAITTSIILTATMHFSTLFLSVASLTTLVSACLTFDGTLSSQTPRKMTGKLVDNSRTVCKIDDYIDEAAVMSAWAAFKCEKGYTAWIQTDGSRIGYYNGAHNYEFAVNEGKTATGKLGQGKKELWAKNYGC